jgi:hypothetical protein
MQCSIPQQSVSICVCGSKLRLSDKFLECSRLVISKIRSVVIILVWNGEKAKNGDTGTRTRNNGVAVTYRRSV